MVSQIRGTEESVKDLDCSSASVIVNDNYIVFGCFRFLGWRRSRVIRSRAFLVVARSFSVSVVLSYLAVGRVDPIA